MFVLLFMGMNLDKSKFVMPFTVPVIRFIKAFSKDSVLSEVLNCGFSRTTIVTMSPTRLAFLSEMMYLNCVLVELFHKDVEKKIVVSIIRVSKRNLLMLSTSSH
jgi:hypothetical protein